MKNYKTQKTIAIVTARGGSKRLPQKNIQCLAGRPLIWHTITKSQKSKYIHTIYVSTEDKKIAKLSREYSAEIIERPKELATDTATTDSVLRHVIETLNFSGNIVLLQPDNPLRTTEDIDESLEKFYQWEPSIVVSLGPNGEHGGGMWIFNTEDYKKVNFVWKELTYLDLYIYLMSTRKSKANIHYKEELEEVEKLIKMTDEEYYKYTLEEHLKKEELHKDRIGMLKNYLDKKQNFEKLKERDENLYKKLRDNPERIALTISIPKGKNCLDIGCSDGLLSIEIAKNGCQHIEGIDIREDAINNANKLKSELPFNLQKRINFRPASLEDLIKEKKKFDTIYLTEVLEHIYFTYHKEFLNLVVSLMKLNSNLIVSVPNRYPKKEYEEDGRARWKFEGHLSHFSKLSLEDLLSKFFLKIEFYTLPNDKRPQEGIFLICNCKGPLKYV